MFRDYLHYHIKVSAPPTATRSCHPIIVLYSFPSILVFEGVHAFSNACQNKRILEGAESRTTRTQTAREEDNYVSLIHI